MIPILNIVVQLIANKRPTNSERISTIVFRLSIVLVLVIVYHISVFYIHRGKRLPVPVPFGGRRDRK